MRIVIIQEVFEGLSTMPRVFYNERDAWNHFYRCAKENGYGKEEEYRAITIVNSVINIEEYFQQSDYKLYWWDTEMD